MRTDLKKWDATEELETEEDIIGYLDACFEEDPGDGSLILAALGDIAKAKGMTDIADKSGITRAALYKALTRGGNPGFVTILKVVRALGLDLGPKPMTARAA